MRKVKITNLVILRIQPFVSVVVILLQCNNKSRISEGGMVRVKMVAYLFLAYVFSVFISPPLCKDNLSISNIRAAAWPAVISQFKVLSDLSNII